jgi:hypothetical protein
MAEAVLVFPAGMPEGLAFRDRAKALGLRVIGASSLDSDPAEGAYEAWERLPFINDPGFDAALAEVLRRHAVAQVHTPHFVVRRHLLKRLAEIAPGARLTSSESIAESEGLYRELRERIAAAKPPSFWPAFPPRPALPPVARVGLIRLVETIPGMCGEEKMHAVMEIMRHAPSGDIVEIGSWRGRSAALFVWLANRYEVGPMLCVDPWDNAAMPQGDPMLDEASTDCDTEETLRIFEINLAPLASGRLNYIRARSEDAAACYGPDLSVKTEAFGETRYSGKIAVLHIDGNHTFEQVERDTAAWTPHVVPGGWIIFDDYVWGWGDGPKRVADAFVEREEARITARFQAGAALFVQLKL